MRRLLFVLAIMVIVAGLYYYQSVIQIAKVSDVKLATAVDAFSAPSRVVEHFQITDKVMFVTMLVYDAPKNTHIRTIWKKGDTILTETEATVSNSQHVSSQLKAKDTLVPGDYTIDIYIGGNVKPVTVLAFHIDS